MNVVIIDDEPIAIDVLKHHLQSIEGIASITTFSSIIKANEYLRTNGNEIDLLLLDIEMPMISGIEYLKANKGKFKVILVTAYKDHAIEAYDLAVSGYLLKPVSFEKLYHTIERIRAEISELEVREQDIEFIFIKTGKKYVKTTYNEIVYIEGLRDYSLLHTLTQRYPVATNLKGIMSQLPSNKFVRVNKSTILNINHVKEVEGDIVKIGSVELSISEIYKDNLFAYIKNNGLFRK